MIRNALLAVGIAGMLGLLWPGPAQAQEVSDTTAACQQTANIVATAVSMRADGSSAARVKRSLTEGNITVGARFETTVAPLVDWVFTIDDALISAPDAPQTIGAQFRRQCLSVTEGAGQ